MLTHRFREQLADFKISSKQSGFIPIPVSAFVFQISVAYVLQVYRLAAEQTREQLKRGRSREIVFSLN